MIKYLVFADMEYYPSPGMYSCFAKVKTFDEVLESITTLKNTFEDFQYVEYIQFYDIDNDISYSVDVENLRETGSIKYIESATESYLNKFE